jgi:hypothetical protein
MITGIISYTSLFVVTSMIYEINGAHWMGKERVWLSYSIGNLETFCPRDKQARIDGML